MTGTQPPVPPTMLNILIADDDDGDRKLMKRVLERAGLPCKCVETSTFDDALAACEKSAFDCALVDYFLTGQDGLAAITALHERLPHMAIIMVTGQGDETIATEAMKRGASDYIPKKHMEAQSIRRRIENAVEKVALLQRIRLQNAILREHEKFQVVVESAPNAMIMIDENGVIKLVNAQTEKLFGYPRHELLGEPVAMLAPERFRERGYPSGFSLGSQGLGADVHSLGEGPDLLGRRKDGDEFPMEVGLNPIQTEEGPMVLSAIVDITDRKRAAEQILTLNRRLERAASEADSANRAKSTFLSTMSHEIRTPLNAILGYAQLIARDHTLGTEARKNLQIIGRSGEHLLTLINDVLDMSKIEAGHTELNPVTFNLSKLIEDLAAMFRLRAQAKALQFQMSSTSGPTVYVVADEGRVRQVLINLLGNAIKFTKQGEIRLSIGLVQRSPRELWFSARVEDTGPGMSAQEQERLFEPFSQTAEALNIDGGTGLGLVISRKYARLMGGDVTVTSKSGEGSTFLFEIPVKPGEAGVAVRSHASARIKGISAGIEPPKVLVVDDHPENRGWLMQLLASVGFAVRDADNGEAALRIWQEWHPRMILMDVHMPGMGGLEATRRIKQGPHGMEALVIVLSASAMEENRRLVAAAGADDFVAKPCREDKLLEKIGALLNIAFDHEESSDESQPPPAAVPLNVNRLRQLPLELLERVREETLRGDKRSLNALIRNVHETGDSETANALQELADKYEYDALTQALEEACRH